MESVVAGVVMVYGLIIFVALAAGIVSYVFQAIGMSTVAKRRNIAGGWTAWVPGANIWLLGAIADDYNLKVKGKKSNLRIWLLVSYIAFMLIGIFYIVFAIASGVLTGLNNGNSEVAFAVFVPLIVIFFIYYGLAIACSILQYIALYKFYQSCEPSNAVLFLILAIFASVATPFLIFYVRNRDEGLPG